MQQPDDDYRLHIAHWSWMKTRVPPQWWPKLTQWPINAGESYWLHRTGTAGAGRERRSSHLWKWNGTIAAILRRRRAVREKVEASTRVVKRPAWLPADPPPTVGTP